MKVGWSFRGSAVLGMASVFVVLELFAAACSPSSDGDGGSSAETTDAPATVDGSDRRDAPTGEINALLPVCETPDSDLVFGGVVGGTSAIKADGAHVYFATTSGLRRVSVDGGSAEMVVAGFDVGTFALTASYVVWSRAGGIDPPGIFWKPKATPLEDGGAGYSETSETRIVSRLGDDYLVVRSGDVYACTAGGTCSGPVLARAGVEGIVAVGAGFDYLAPSSGGLGVFTCSGSCTSDPGVLLAEGATAGAIVSDDATIYWISQSARKVLRVKRSGGSIEDVIVNVHGAFALALDTEGRIVVATLGSGVHRGPKTGTCRAVGGSQYSSITASPTGVYVYANGGSIRRLR